DRHDGGPGRVHAEGVDPPAVDAGRGDRLTRGRDQGGQVVGVALGGVIRVVPTAVQRVRGRAGPEPAAVAVEDGHADALRPEIDAGDDAHAASGYEWG